MKCKTPSCTRPRRAHEDGSGSYYDYCGKSCRDGSFTKATSSGIYFYTSCNSIIITVFGNCYYIQPQWNHAIFLDAKSEGMWILPIIEFMTIVGEHMPIKHSLRVSFNSSMNSLTHSVLVLSLGEPPNIPCTSVKKQS